MWTCDICNSSELIRETLEFLNDADMPIEMEYYCVDCEHHVNVSKERTEGENQWKNKQLTLPLSVTDSSS